MKVSIKYGKKCLIYHSRSQPALNKIRHVSKYKIVVIHKPIITISSMEECILCLNRGINLV